MNNETLRLATRGSDLAMAQAETVATRLRSAGYDTELVTVQTTGDQIRDGLIHRLGKTGAFVRSLDEKVLAGEVDGAIHSMKDMPTERPNDLVVAGVPRREIPNDVLATANGMSLKELPKHASVGTASLRRRAQLRHTRSDLDIAPLRGNVDTRVEKLLAPPLQRNKSNDDGTSLSPLEAAALEREIEIEYDAIVLSAAGLRRSELMDEVCVHRIPVSSFVPSAGQGALAITATRGSPAHSIFEDVLDYEQTRVETGVERAILAELGGGCIAPIGVYASVTPSAITVRVQVFDVSGEVPPIDEQTELRREGYLKAAREFGTTLEERGAAELVERARAISESDA